MNKSANVTLNSRKSISSNSNNNSQEANMTTTAKNTPFVTREQAIAAYSNHSEARHAEGFAGVFGSNAPTLEQILAHDAAQDVGKPYTEDELAGKKAKREYKPAVIEMNTGDSIAMENPMDGKVSTLAYDTEKRVGLFVVKNASDVTPFNDGRDSFEGGLWAVKGIMKVMRALLTQRYYFGGGVLSTHRDLLQGEGYVMRSGSVAYARGWALSNLGCITTRKVVVSGKNNMIYPNLTYHLSILEDGSLFVGDVAKGDPNGAESFEWIFKVALAMSGGKMQLSVGPDTIEMATDLHVIISLRNELSKLEEGTDAYNKMFIELQDRVRELRTDRNDIREAKQTYSNERVQVLKIAAVINADGEVRLADGSAKINDELIHLDAEVLKVMCEEAGTFRVAISKDGKFGKSTVFMSIRGQYDVWAGRMNQGFASYKLIK